MKEDVFVYRIDADDTVLSVSDNWCAFAHANSASDHPPPNVVGRCLWDFISGAETCYLYRELFAKVRAGKQAGPIPFRCDSPGERRFMELSLTPLPEGHIEITSRIVRTESRPPVRLLDADAPRSNRLLKMCSLCKQILIAPDTWVELDEALKELRLFEQGRVPNVSHGACHGCYQIMLEELED